MSVILAFGLILWVWGRAGTFATRTGHGNGSKIDFLFDAYSAVARYPQAGKNWEMHFQPAKVQSGLHKPYYQLQDKTMINKGFCR